MVLVLGGLALGAAALALGAARLERSEALRRVLALETEAALGAPLEYRQASVGWLPPRVELSGVVLTLPGGVLLRAPSAVLEIESSALFSGLVRVESARADNGVVEWGAEGRAMLRGPCRLEARQHAPGAWTLALEAELESGGSLRANATAPGVWRAEIEGLEIAPLARAASQGSSGDVSSDARPHAPSTSPFEAETRIRVSVRLPELRTAPPVSPISTVLPFRRLRPDTSTRAP